MGFGTALVLWIALFAQLNDESRADVHTLTELVSLDSTIRLDIRYATEQNFIGKKVYDQPRAFLQRPAAEALVRVHRHLLKKGFGLLVFDGYRPLSVTQMFWDLTPPEKRQFVANPKTGSRHNRGCAVDLSLYDIKTGREVSMPSGYDEMGPNAAPHYKGGTRQQRAHRNLLITAMRREGFSVNPIEWWHFDYKTWSDYPLLDIPFSAIR